MVADYKSACLIVASLKGICHFPFSRSFKVFLFILNIVHCSKGWICF